MSGNKEQANKETIPWCASRNLDSNYVLEAKILTSFENMKLPNA